jgi:surfeit locus 1 family protein
MRDERSRAGPLARPVLTVATLLALAVLIGLGVWQVRRLQWKEALLTEVAAARASPPANVMSTLKRADRGEEVNLTRVAGRCPQDGPPARFLYDLEEGQVAWRVLGECDLGGRWSGLLLDRGVLEAATGLAAPPRGYAPPRQDGWTAVLRRADDRLVYLPDGRTASLRSLSPSGYFLSVEAEDRPAPGIRPAALPDRISNNHLGYALTWFGLAAALLGVYLAMMFKQPRRA